MTVIESYLADLSSRLHVSRGSRAALVAEVREHLLESAERACANGAARQQAETNAVAAFGSTTLMARQFNAASGARAMRRAPVVALVTGATVVGGFLVAAVARPGTSQQATAPMQVSFFLAILAFQVAVTAGARGASRAFATWRTSAAAGLDRALVRRSTIICTAALLSGAVLLSTNFVLAAHHSPNMRGVALGIGAFTMTVTAIAGLALALHLNINPDDNDDGIDSTHTSSLLQVGETTISLVSRHPLASCTTVTVAATAWAMTHAEAHNFTAALPWGIGEAVAVITTFMILGPSLGLRTTRQNGRLA